MKKILIPIDGSDYSEKAMETGREMASAMDADIVLLNVTPLSVYPMKNTPKFRKDLKFQYHDSEVSEDAETYLKECREKFGEMASRVDTVVLDGDPADMILKYLESHDIDLVVMGSHGLGASTLRQLFIGSVAGKVIHYACQPVVIVKCLAKCKA